MKLHGKYKTVYKWKKLSSVGQKRPRVELLLQRLMVLVVDSSNDIGNRFI